MTYTEVTGNLLDLDEKFHIIAHGCNCFNLMDAGIAKQFKEKYKTDSYSYEADFMRGDISKLGNIEFRKINGTVVANLYTQFKPGKHLSYVALSLCLTKLNYQFPGKKIGLPKIGCGIAGGDWNIVKSIIRKHLTNMHITIVNYENSN